MTDAPPARSDRPAGQLSRSVKRPVILDRARARIRAASRLPACREDIELWTEDGVRLVGELATPLTADARATLAMVHPLPTEGGSMDAHLFRKASWRLPALAGIAVLRFNLRGVTSRRGTSGGAFDGGRGEKYDVRAAIQYARDRPLPDPWLVGWSFGADVVAEHGCGQPDHSPGPSCHPVAGAILIAPPLRWSTPQGYAGWARSGLPLHAIVPEFDHNVSPDRARERLACVPQAQVHPVAGAGHLLLGEPAVRHVLDEIVRVVAPEVSTPLPDQWAGVMESVPDV